MAIQVETIQSIEKQLNRILGHFSSGNIDDVAKDVELLNTYFKVKVSNVGEVEEWDGN